VSEFDAWTGLTFAIKGIVNILGCFLQRRKIGSVWA
jgi:hypothetical protein